MGRTMFHLHARPAFSSSSEQKLRTGNGHTAEHYGVLNTQHVHVGPPTRVLHSRRHHQND